MKFNEEDNKFEFEDEETYAIDVIMGQHLKEKLKAVRNNKSFLFLTQHELFMLSGLVDYRLKELTNYYIIKNDKTPKA